MTTVDPRSLKRVLYIEDNAESRYLVRRMLSDRYLVLEAADALDGLQLAEETTPDMVLLDQNLPRMTGSEAAIRLRKILPEALLIIISADDSPGARERALVTGAVGFIPKPIDVETFSGQIDAFFRGQRDELDNPEHHMREYQQELVEHLEENIRHLTQTLERNQFLLQQNSVMIAMLERRQKLLEAAARVGQFVTSILDINSLMNRTVDIICNEFELYYSGIFLLSDDRQWAELQAGFGEAGAQMLRSNFRLPVDRASMIGVAILEKKAQVTADVLAYDSHFKNPYLRDTRSEIALPLKIKTDVLGALTVQSDRVNAFAEEDVTALQTMADQVAIAINNARLLQEH
jgi:CheY-like chemotaxis protein